MNDEKKNFVFRLVNDAVEIAGFGRRAFVSTFVYMPQDAESETDSPSPGETDLPSQGATHPPLETATHSPGEYPTKFLPDEYATGTVELNYDDFRIPNRDCSFEFDGKCAVDFEGDLGIPSLDIYGCAQATKDVEDMVEEMVDDCNPLKDVYTEDVAKMMKQTIKTATTEDECAGLKLYSQIAPGENKGLMATCAEVCYWCCCETIKKVSPIIAEATANLLIEE